MSEQEKRVSVDDILVFLHTKGYKTETAGDKAVAISTFCSLNMPKSNAVTWIKSASPESLQRFAGQDNLIVVAKEVVPAPCPKICFLLTQEPKAVFFDILHCFWEKKAPHGIAETAVVESDMIAPDVTIGHHCCIGPDVSIGSGTILENNVTIINKATIGSGCLVHSGVVIGTDGFGFFQGHEGWPCKVEHFGGVSIGDDVEIGANTCIDRGTIDDTVIGSHVKIDNLVHIGHNVQIADSAVVVAGAILCGSSKLGLGCYIAPGGIVKNQLAVGRDALVGMGAVVIDTVEPDTIVTGVPAKPLRKVRPGDR